MRKLYAEKGERVSNLLKVENPAAKNVAGSCDNNYLY
jgi:hypothetical protein